MKEIEGDETAGGGGRRRQTASYSLKQPNLPYTSETGVGRGHLPSFTDRLHGPAFTVHTDSLTDLLSCVFYML